MNYPLEKYKYFTYDNKNGGKTVVAISTYAGKTVKGYAKCDPRDEYSIEKGKDLAAHRCNLKIAEKRQARAAKKYLEAIYALEQAQLHFDKMKKYFMDADDQVDEAAAALRDVIAGM